MRWRSGVFVIATLLAGCGEKPSAPAIVLASAAPSERPNVIEIGAEPKFIEDGANVEFRSDQDLSRYALVGFSAAEEGGVWTQGKQAQITLPLSPTLIGKPIWLEVTAVGFVAPPKLVSTDLVLSVAGKPLGRTTFAKSLETRTLRVAVPAEFNTSDKLQLILDLPNAASPKALGTSPDLRELGVYLNSITVTSSRE